MFVSVSLTIVLAAAVACLPVHLTPRANSTDPADVVLKIRDALTGIGRQNILAEGGQKSFVFDFANPPPHVIEKFSGGTTVQAKDITFPTLTGVSLTVGTVILDPCSMQQPHTHPRAGEFILVIEGSVMTQFKAEEDTEIVKNEVPFMSSTFFPKGSIHSSFNPHCSQATFIEVFDSNDQGTIIAASNLFSFDDKLVRAVVGGDTVLSAEELANIRSNMKGFLVSDQDCLVRCGMNYTSRK